MHKILYISFFICLVVVFVFQDIRSQDLPQVCAGSKVRYGVSGQPSLSYFWDVTGGMIINNYNDSIDVLWDNNPGVHTIKYVAQSPGGCVSAPVYGNIMLTPVSSLFSTKTILVCEGESFLLQPIIPVESIIWNNGSINSSIRINKAGYYSAMAHLKSGCNVSDTILLVVQPKPVFSLGNDTSLCENQRLVIDPQVLADAYEWSTGETTPTIKVYENAGIVWAKLSGVNGCTFTDTVLISSCSPKDRSRNVPNGFTPNNDNDNDTWRIEYLDKYPQAGVAIYNRWGQLVFQTVNSYPADGWDGTNNGKPLPMSTYFYVIDLKDGSPPIVGSVNLIR